MCCLPLPVQREIVAQVFRRVARAEMFTAWDVRAGVVECFAASDRGERIPHYEVRNIVHALFFHGAMGPDYVRTAAPVGAGGETAFVYHRLSDAPGLYVAAQQSAAHLFQSPPASNSTGP